MTKPIVFARIPFKWLYIAVIKIFVGILKQKVNHFNIVSYVSCILGLSQISHILVACIYNHLIAASDWPLSFIAPKMFFCLALVETDEEIIIINSQL